MKQKPIFTNIPELQHYLDYVDELHSPEPKYISVDDDGQIYYRDQPVSGEFVIRPGTH